MPIDAILKTQALAQSQFEFECKTCQSDNVNFQMNGKAICLECDHEWRWEPIKVPIHATPPKRRLPPSKNQSIKRTEDDKMNQQIRTWLDSVEPDDKPLEQPWQDLQEQASLILPKRRKRGDEATEPLVVTKNESSSSTTTTAAGANSRVSSAHMPTTTLSVTHAVPSARLLVTRAPPSDTITTTRISSPGIVSVTTVPPSIVSVTRAPSTTVSVTRAPSTTISVTRAPSTTVPVTVTTRTPLKSVPVTRAPLSSIMKASNIPPVATRSSSPLVNKNQEIRHSLDITKDDIPTSILTNLQPNIHRYPPTLAHILHHNHNHNHKNSLHAPRTSSPLSGRRPSQPPTDENNDPSSSLADLARRHREQKAAMLLRCASLNSKDI